MLCFINASFKTGITVTFSYANGTQDWAEEVGVTKRGRPTWEKNDISRDSNEKFVLFHFIQVFFKEYEDNSNDHLCLSAPSGVKSIPR